MFCPPFYTLKSPPPLHCSCRRQTTFTHTHTAGGNHQPRRIPTYLQLLQPQLLLPEALLASSHGTQHTTKSGTQLHTSLPPLFHHSCAHWGDVPSSLPVHFMPPWLSTAPLPLPPSLHACHLLSLVLPHCCCRRPASVLCLHHPLRPSQPHCIQTTTGRQERTCVGKSTQHKSTQHAARGGVDVTQGCGHKRWHASFLPFLSQQPTS